MLPTLEHWPKGLNSCRRHNILLSLVGNFLHFSEHTIKAVATAMIERIEKRWKYSLFRPQPIPNTFSTIQMEPALSEDMSPSAVRKMM